MVVQQLMMQAAVISVESIGITVLNMDLAVEFYAILSFYKISDVEVLGTASEHLRVVRMQLGAEVIELTEYLTPKGRAIPPDSRSNDQWFQHIAIAVSNMDKAYQHLRQHKVQHTSTAPQRLPDWNPAVAGIEAFYFKDPDGHNLELIYFPPGKGAKWQQPTDQIFLGIDHTAIVVSNTETSLKFYRNFLGMKLVGESENYGTEQEHLNNVSGARLRISSLKAPTGPGVELLEYLTPRDGRPIPGDARPNDLIHWQTTLVVRDVEAASKLCAGIPSPKSAIAIPDRALGFKKGFLVRDSDGHVMRLVEKQV